MQYLILNLPHTYIECVDEAAKIVNDTVRGNPNTEVTVVDLVEALKRTEKDIKAVFVAPGAQALKLTAAISKEHSTALRERVENGAGYVGFCTGGIWGTKTAVIHGLRPRNKQPYEAKAPMLGLLEGVYAEGPAFAKYDGYTIEETGMQAKSVSVNDGRKLNLGWCHGPAFRGEHGNVPPEYTTVATFDDASARASAAVVFGACGKGKVVISGVHPEMAPDNEGPGEASARETFFWDLLEMVTPEH